MDRSSPAPLSTAGVWDVVDRERLGLADLLETLSDDEWAAPSLCEGWRVRDVAAHLTLAHMPPGRAVVEAVRAGGRFDAMVRDTALRHAAAPRAQLVAELRAMVGSRRRAPGLSPLEPMLDVLVHGQDIALPLRRERRMPLDAAATAATRVWTSRWPMSVVCDARRRLRGLRLVADDVDWAVGDGARVEGPVEALLLVLTGRSAAVRDRLRGPGTASLPVEPDVRGDRGRRRLTP